MTTRNSITVVVGLYVLGGMAYAATRVGSLAWLPTLAPLALGLLVGFRAGQYARGYGHARGIRRSHWAAIGGGHK